MKKYILKYRQIMSALIASAFIIMSVFCIDGSSSLFAQEQYSSEDTSYGDIEGEEDTATEYIITTEYPDEPGRAPDIVSNAAIVMDAKTGNILYEKNATEKKYPASITKIMTCYLALQNCKFDETLTMSEDAIWGIERDSSHIALDVGESITMEEGLYALMLESANEVAWAIGEHVSGGSITEFAELMNQTAKELGCKGTHFSNANGLHDDNHYTTCYDMALITKAALTLDDFRTITGTLSSSVAPTNLCDVERPLNLHCNMVKPYSTYYYEYCEGGKTGYTEEALNTLVTWAKKGDTELICVVMDCMGSWNTYTDSKALYEYCFNSFSHLSPAEIVRFTDTDKETAISRLNNFYNTDYKSDINLSVDSDYYLSVKTGWNTKDITTEISYNDTISYDALTATYNIGNIIFKYEGNAIGQTAILISGYTIADNKETNGAKASSEALRTMTDSDKNKKHSFHVILVIAVIFALLAGLFLAYTNHVRKQRIKKTLARKREYEKRLSKIMEDIDNDL
ncbi:MAG: D-alanyl-D-alanine carboxypeptidase [Coprococcus sp.]|nr:D-alanyl-D-alanine carboxypeptidase [Coprococcus sp.]